LLDLIFISIFNQCHELVSSEILKLTKATTAMFNMIKGQSSAYTYMYGHFPVSQGLNKDGHTKV